MYKNVASQKVAVFAFDIAANAAKTGDAGNITAQISLDGGATAASDDTNPTELDATDAPGIYLFDVTQAETNGDLFILYAKSSTGNVLLDPVVIHTTPGNNTTLTDILTDTAEIGAAGAGLTEAGGDGDHLTEAGGDGDHLTEAGGTGDQFSALPLNDITAADAADAVWNELSTGHTDAGKAGEQLWTDVDAILSDTGTDGVVLANDAITSAKFDESTAYPLESADSGSTQIARVGADGDTLETISDQIDLQATSAALSTHDGKLDTVDSNVDAILVDTDTTIPGLINALNDISVSDVLTTAMTESYASDGSAPTLAQALFAIQQFLQERSVSSTTVTVKKLDGSTSAMTFTLNDAAVPTSITRAT